MLHNNIRGKSIVVNSLMLHYDKVKLNCETSKCFYQLQIYAKPLYYAIVFEPMTVMPIYLWLTLLGIFVLKLLKMIEDEYMFITLRITSPRTRLDDYVSWAIYEGSTRETIQWTF